MNMLNNENVEYIKYMSHIFTSIIFAITLKNKYPLALATLLSVMLLFIVNSKYDTSNGKLIMLPTISIIIYLIFNYIDLVTDVNTRKIEYQKKQLWKIPFYGILVHYVLDNVNLFN